MLQNNTGKTVHINWNHGTWYYVKHGDVVDLPDSYAGRYGFDVVKEEVVKEKKSKVFNDLDVNKDGSVDFKDVIAIAKKIVTKGKKKKNKR